MTDQVPVSVVIPTVGRPELVAQALESLGRCDPRAAEVLVVDQSADRSASDVVGRFSHVRARLELSRLYERYWREQARFYGKHLRRGDIRVVRFVVRDAAYGLLHLLRAAGRGAGAAAVALGAGRRPPTISAFKYLMGQMSRAETVPSQWSYRRWGVRSSSRRRSARWARVLLPRKDFE
jgi:glycosyltransferase involved in cell wall biosynthesis